jgi:dTDP-4-dehydrorhamnose 3,5-epimerase
MAFVFKPMSLPGVVYVEPRVHRDPRGFFVELFKSSEFAKNGIPANFAQVNQSKSQKDVLRGLHYQLSAAGQGKLVTVISGEIFDVAVDIRKGSPHYGQWVSARLDAVSKNMLYIPEGFLHGFCVLSPEAEIVYFCTREYAPAFDRSVRWNDPAIGIDWPVMKPVLSAKDSESPLLINAENDFIYA